MERKPAKTFEDLVVWQKAHKFVLDVYAYTAAFPKEEIYGLTSQFGRAAVSITANLADVLSMLCNKYERMNNQIKNLLST